MDLQWLFLILIAVVVVFGLGVLVLSRRRAGGVAPPRDRPIAPPDRPPTSGPEADTAGDTLVEEPPTVETVEPITVEPVTLRGRMAKARATLAGAFAGVRSRSAIDAETWDELEEALLRADVGVKVTDALLEELRARVERSEITDPEALLDALQVEMTDRLSQSDRSLATPAGTGPNGTGPNGTGPNGTGPDGTGPDVWLFVGVNGVGKTTTIGKIAQQQIKGGHTVLMAAGDTFRAAAAEQLSTWADRSGAEFVRGAEGGDPSSVIFDGVERAASRGIELVLADTAGRLHTKTNLMDELRKVRRVAEKGAGRVTETLLVIDATTGQNGLTQAREFGEATQVTGVVLTKLDGSAKGGIVFAIETELGIPVKLVGVGETIDDLLPFDPEEFVAALFDR
jgi:fused signal recognition particle receptor